MNRLFSGRSDMPFALLLLAPSLLLLGGLVAWPMVSNIEISFFHVCRSIPTSSQPLLG